MSNAPSPRRFPVAMSILAAAVFLLGIGVGTPVLHAQAEEDAKPARCVILFIGDGMGPHQVEAARLYAGEPLVFERLPVQTSLATASADSEVTDSAAAATALATGHRVNNGVLSRAMPGDGQPLTTALEILAQQGKATGLVTSVPILHATPAAFAAHVEHRKEAQAIAQDYLTVTRPDLLLGSGGMGMELEDAADAGYTVVTTREELFSQQAQQARRLWGLFGGGRLPYEYDAVSGSDDGFDKLPHLSELTRAALAFLERDPDGFFLMVEGGLIDWASHDNQIERAVLETIELSRAVQVALDWAKDRDDVLILVTADHETGGLEILEDRGARQFPEVSWSTRGHTATPVPLYAWGRHASWAADADESADVFDLLIGRRPQPRGQEPAVAKKNGQGSGEESAQEDAQESVQGDAQEDAEENGQENVQEDAEQPAAAAP
ncbi:MAG TPA: alkaline phosphatase [Phycisphaeraceae bacterium]